VFFHDSTASRMATFDLDEAYAELIMRDGDIEDNWRAWVETQAPLINPVIAELNAMLP